MRDRTRGLSWTRIAEWHGLCERQCRNIWTEYLRDQPLEKTDLRDALVEAIAQHDAVIEDLALLEETTTNDPVRLGAIKARLDTLTRRQELLRLSGLLPYPVHTAIKNTQQEEAIKLFHDVFHRYVPKESHDAARQELLDALVELRAA